MGISLGYGKHFDSLKGQGVSTRRTDYFRDDVLESDFTITPDSYPLTKPPEQRFPVWLREGY
jgi:hypothetical protein